MIGNFFKLNLLGLILVFTSYIVIDKASAGSVAGSLDKVEGSLQDEFLYTLTIQGENMGSLPEFPAIDGLRIEQAGTSQSYSNINGVSSTTWQVNFVIQPMHEGSFVIPSLTMSVDGSDQQTLPIAFLVKKAPASPQEGAEVFIERQIDDHSVFIGQPLLSKMLIYTRVELNRPNLEVGTYDGFQRIEIKGEKNYTKVLGNQKYNVIELAEVLVPQQEGSFNLPILQLTTIVPDSRQQPRRVDPFGFMDNRRGIRKRFTSKPLGLKVSPLPTEGRPLGFSGLVGVFNLETSFTAKEVKQGDTVTLTIKISGRGSTKGMKEPTLTLPSHVKVYKDKPEEQELVDRQTGLVSAKTFRYALVVNRPGKIDLGAINEWYFNTKSERYEKLSESLGSLAILPNKNAEPAIDGGVSSGVIAKNEVKAIGQDIISLHRGPRSLATQAITDDQLWLLFAMPLSAQGVLWSVFIWRRLSVNPEDRRRRKRQTKALRTFLQNSKTLGAQPQDPGSAMMNLEQNFKAFIGDKFALEGQAMTSNDLQKKLQTLNIKEPLIDQAKTILDVWDRINYGSEKISQQSYQTWASQLNELVKEVDKIC